MFISLTFITYIIGRPIIFGINIQTSINSGRDILKIKQKVNYNSNSTELFLLEPYLTHSQSNTPLDFQLPQYLLTSTEAG